MDDRDASRRDPVSRGTDRQSEAAPLARPRRGSFPGSELLVGASPREVLERLTEAGDPFELEARGEQRLRERAFLIAAHRVRDRALARVAHASMRYEGEPALDVWLTARVDEAIADLLAEEAADERRGVPATEPWDPRYAMITEIAGVEPAQARGMCVAFNALPDEVRATAFAILVEGTTFNRYVAQGYGPPERVKAHLKRALLTLLLMRDPDAPELEDEL